MLRVELLVKYAIVVGVSMLKLVLGPFTALGLGLNPAESAALSALGMTFTAFLVAYVGERVRGPLRDRLAARFPNRFGRPPNPRLQAIFDRWGLPGIAFLTPVLLSPPGGAIAAVAFGIERPRIVFAMSLSAIGWSAVYTTAFYRFGEELAARGLITLP